MLHLLQGALNPPLGLRKCIGEWDAISLDLREPPRRRALQAENLEQDVALLS